MLKQCERELVLYGYVRGSHLKPGMKVHLIGAGDFDMTSVRCNAECLYTCSLAWWCLEG